MNITESKLCNIEYTSDATGDTTVRPIIPFSVPKDFIRAIDVSELSDEDAAAVVEMVARYKEYFSNHIKTAFTFEDWVAHTLNLHFEPKWRSFKISGIVINE